MATEIDRYRDRIAKQSVIYSLRNARQIIQRRLENEDGASSQPDLDELFLEEMAILDSMISLLSTPYPPQDTRPDYSFQWGFEFGVRMAKKKIASNMSRCYDSGAAQIVLASTVTLDG